MCDESLYASWELKKIIMKQTQTLSDVNASLLIMNATIDKLQKRNNDLNKRLIEVEDFINKTCDELSNVLKILLKNGDKNESKL